MFLNRKIVVSAVLIIGTPTMAFAQIPNPLDWWFPHQPQQQRNNPSGGQENERHCSMEQQQNSYINQCGELIRGWQDMPVGGG